jgi:hypothetical protein
MAASGVAVYRLVKGEGLSRLPWVGAPLDRLGRGVAIAPAITAWNAMAFLPRLVNQRSAQPYHESNQHNRRPIDRGIPNRQIWASA